MSFIVPALLLAIIVFQGFVTWKVWRNDSFLRSEKMAQSRLVWLLPLLGAVMVYSVISEEDNHSGPSSHLRS